MQTRRGYENSPANASGSGSGPEKDAFFFTPVLSEVVYGDGKAVFGFTTCHDRPEYWVVRGDSRWLEDRRNEKGWMMEGNDIIKESIDYILENLAIEFGNAVDPRRRRHGPKVTLPVDPDPGRVQLVRTLESEQGVGGRE